MSKPAKILPLPASAPASLTAISKPCFAAMQSQTSLALTMPYHAEELDYIEKILKATELSGEEIDCFVAIGCANLRYADVAFRHCWSYTAIEPSLDAAVMQDTGDMMRRLSGIRIVAKNLEDVCAADLPRGRKLFFFLFNVFPYIKDAEAKIRELAKPGDLVVVSSWNESSDAARKLKETYYNYLTSQFNCTISDKIDPLYLDKLEKNAPTMSSTAARNKGHTTDILTLRIK